jgi:MraZ protein
MDQLEQKTAGQGVIVDPPHSISQASVDDKGRLKLPSEFVECLERCGISKVFITTVDFRSVRLYPLSLWQHNENLFDDAGEDTGRAARLARLAKHFGGDAEIDKSGRVLLPSLLRQEMELEKQTVFVDAHCGRLNVVSKKIDDEEIQAARASAAEDLKVMEKRGFK